MTASDDTVAVAGTAAATPGLSRLRMAEPASGNLLDGGWWPRSRDLPAELADLVEHFPPELGRIVGARVAAADWDLVVQHVPTAGGQVLVRSLPGGDTHLIELATSARRVLRVLVVPPGLTEDQGQEALLAAATAGDAHSAADLLRELTEYPDVDSHDLWDDPGGSWWGPDPVAPSIRTGG